MRRQSSIAWSASSPGRQRVHRWSEQPETEGVNTIAFAVSSSGGPTGLREERDLTAN